MKYIIKILRVLVGLGIGAYLILALSHTAAQMDGQRVEKISVEIRDLDVVDFIDGEMVIQGLVNRSVKITGEPIDSINKSYIREIVKDMPHTKDAEVYFTPDGIFHIKVWQRIPVMRVITGSSDFYVDAEGEVFPVSDRFTSMVPVFTGNISDDLIREGLLDFAGLLNRDAFWGAMIDQVHVWNPKHIEIVPKLGQHRVYIGSVEHMEWKLTKLKAVYEKALPKVGWDVYSSIDLRFGDQVICNRKNES